MSAHQILEGFWLLCNSSSINSFKYHWLRFNGGVREYYVFAYISCLGMFLFQYDFDAIGKRMYTSSVVFVIDEFHGLADLAK